MIPGFVFVGLLFCSLVSVFFSGSSECVGGVLLVLLACSTGMFMKTLAGVGGKGRSGREGLVFWKEWPVALCYF